MYGIETPSLASLAEPYYNMIRKVAWEDPYAFKDMVRTDFLKDAYVPAKQAGAAYEYLQNVYNIRNRQNTMETDLARSSYDSRLGMQTASDNLRMYPTLRPLWDRKAVSDATGNVYDSEFGVAEARDKILMQEAQSAYGNMQATTPGLDFLDQADKIYEKVINDPSAGVALRNVAQQRVIEAAQYMLSMAEPGSAEYERARQTLIRVSQFGSIVGPTPPQGGLSYSVTGGQQRPSAIEMYPGYNPPMVADAYGVSTPVVPTAGAWEPL